MNGITENLQEKKPTLVLGGTGKTGRRVVARLKARDQPPFDWEDQATWLPALQGVGSAYISYYPDIAAPGAIEKVGAFSELAVANGVRRLVLLAGRGEPEPALSHRPDSSNHGIQRATEQRPGGRRPGERRGRPALGRLPYQLDGLEPHSDGGVASRSGIAHHRPLLLSGERVMFYRLVWAIATWPRSRLS